MNRLLAIALLPIAGCSVMDADTGAFPLLDFATGEMRVGDLTLPPPVDFSGASPDADLAFGSNADLFGINDDKTGPLIEFVAPIAGSFVAGVLTVSITITDPAGVDDRSIAVKLGGTHGNPGLDIKVTRVPNSDVFSGTVDTRMLPTEIVLPILAVSVSDLVPTPNFSAAAITVIVDNVNPAIDLDPREDVHALLDVIDRVICSRPFDPVGDWAVDDGDTIKQLSVVRARIEDRGNQAEGQTLTWYSNIRPNSVKFYIAPVSYGPLVVDGDGDGICDDVNPNLVPVPGGNNMGKATQVGMAPLVVQGSADFRLQMGDNVCPGGIGDVAYKDPPQRVCFNDMTLHMGVLRGAEFDQAIWSIPPLPLPPNPACEGLQFDAKNSDLPEGPLCAAVVAWDNAGNRNVSRPLRLCLDKGNNKCAAYVGHGSENLPPCGTEACEPGVRMNYKEDGKWVREDPFPSPTIIVK